MQGFKFLKWKVYQDSQVLFSKILLVVKNLPKEYRFELGSQVVRSSLSIVLNIAEGSGKTSDKELNRYIDISLGSAYETLAVLDALNRNKFIKESEFNDFHEEVEQICKQLGGFKKNILSSL